MSSTSWSTSWINKITSLNHILAKKDRESVVAIPRLNVRHRKEINVAERGATMTNVPATGLLLYLRSEDTILFSVFLLSLICYSILPSTPTLLRSLRALSGSYKYSNYRAGGIVVSLAERIMSWKAK